MLASYWLLWIGLFFIVVIIVLSLSKVELKFFVRRKNEDDAMKMTITALYGLVSFSLKMPSLQLNTKGIGFRVKKSDGSDTTHEFEVDEAISNFELILDMLDMIKEFKVWFRNLLYKVELLNWRWHSVVGTGEAMSAALSCGALWSIKGLIFGRISRFMKVMNAPDVVIQPQFQHKVFITEWSCTLKLKLGSLIVASFYLLFHFTQFRKSLRLWKTLVSRV